MEINKVIICGLGALGLTYAKKLQDLCELKVLADIKRIQNYQIKVPTLNNEKVFLEYLCPSDNWDPDLIIIATKSTGLDSAIKYLKNFVNKNTIIISLINGISSEEIIKKAYPQAEVVRSYFIGHSAIRVDNKTTQDGIGKIVFEPNTLLENFMKKNNIDHEISNDIIYSQWIKLGVNIILNEPSALLECNVGELRKQKNYMSLAQNLLHEVKNIAQAYGIKKLGNYEAEVFEAANLISDSGKTSMYQDVLAKRKTEVDIFSGEIIKLGKSFGIETPTNQDIYNKIKDKEASWEKP